MSFQQVKAEDNFNPEEMNSEQVSEVYKVPKKQKKNENGVQGKWSDFQNIRYVIFMDFYRDIFNSRQKRRLSKIFKAMSKCISSRSAVQCRSHHQKLIEKYGSFKKVIAAVKINAGSDYHEAYSLFAASQKTQPFLTFSIEQERRVGSVDVEVQTDPVVIMSDGEIIGINTLNSGLMSVLSQMMASVMWCRSL